MMVNFRSAIRYTVFFMGSIYVHIQYNTILLANLTRRYISRVYLQQGMAGWRGVGGGVSEGRTWAPISKGPDIWSLLLLLVLEGTSPHVTHDLCVTQADTVRVPAHTRTARHQTSL